MCSAIFRFFFRRGHEQNREFPLWRFVWSLRPLSPEHAARSRQSGNDNSNSKTSTRIGGSATKGPKQTGRLGHQPPPSLVLSCGGGGGGGGSRPVGRPARARALHCGAHPQLTSAGFQCRVLSGVRCQVSGDSRQTRPLNTEPRGVAKAARSSSARDDARSRPDERRAQPDGPDGWMRGRNCATARASSLSA